MILFSRFWDENISGLFKTSQVLNSSFKCVDKLYIFNALMIVNNIITTIMGIKGKVNTDTINVHKGELMEYKNQTENRAFQEMLQAAVKRLQNRSGEDLAAKSGAVYPVTVGEILLQKLSEAFSSL